MKTEKFAFPVISSRHSISYLSDVGTGRLRFSRNDFETLKLCFGCVLEACLIVNDGTEQYKDHIACTTWVNNYSDACIVDDCIKIGKEDWPSWTEGIIEVDKH